LALVLPSLTDVARAASRAEARCHDWEALKSLLQTGQEIAYQFDGRQLHVWATGSPQRGDRCKCGAQTWV
jgi:hypothetical protein